jgi:hypothetical protein
MNKLLSRLTSSNQKIKRRQDMNDESHKESAASQDKDDVDVTLIRWMLSLTPEDRLRILENNIWSLLRLRSGTFQA